MRKKLLAVLAASLIALGSLSIVEVAKPIVIQEQGSFTVGGTYKERPGKFSQENFVAEDGQRAYGDFAYVEYQIPVKAKKLPLIFQHGGAHNRNALGNPDPTVEKALIPCSCVPAIRFI